MRSLVIINNAGALGIGFTTKINGQYVERNYLVGTKSYIRLLEYINRNELVPTHELGQGTIMSGAIFELPDKSAQKPPPTGGA